MNDKKIELCALWKNTTKEGKTYLSGNIGGAKVLVFANEYKKEEREPDYRVYLVPREKEPRASAPSAPPPAVANDDDPMPF